MGYKCILEKQITAPGLDSVSLVSIRLGLYERFLLETNLQIHIPTWILLKIIWFFIFTNLVKSDE